ncbi:MAG: hypothetical protein ACP5HK_01995 [Acidilobus sp.]
MVGLLFAWQYAILPVFLSENISTRVRYSYIAFVINLGVAFSSFAPYIVTALAYSRNSGFVVDKVVFVRKLPKTKSGKMLRRLLRAEPLGDTSMLEGAKAFEETMRIIEQVREEFKKAIGAS